MSSSDRPPGTGPARSLAQARQALLELRERQRGSSRGTAERITPAARDRALPLSFNQRQLWFLDQWSGGRPVYHDPTVLRLVAPLDYAALQRTLTMVASRHEVLRTRYPAQHGVPYQHIEPAPAAVPLPVHDFSGHDDPSGAVRQFVAGHIRRPFDLAAGPVLRAALAKLGETEHVLALAVHHIATDGWSNAILTRELVAGYLGEVTGQPAELPGLPVQYADYAVWQRGWLTGDVLARQLQYWRGQLADLPTLDFPTDRPRKVQPAAEGATVETVLPGELLEAVNRLARQERVTTLTVYLAVFTALMSRYTGQHDIAVGSVFAGRTRPEIEHLIGFFSNTLVLRTSTAGDPPFRELLARTGRTVLDAHVNQELPFDHLVDELSPHRDPARNPLFQICFTVQHAAADRAAVGDVWAEAYPAETGTARFDLAVQLTETPGRGLRMWAEYSTELFDASRIARLFTHYEYLLRQAIGDPGRRLSEMELLTVAERERLTVSWNETTRHYGATNRCLHHLVESATDADPTALALASASGQVTYSELDRRANRLAWALIEAGIRPETLVAVLARRGPELAVAFLGIHKAGGAYLPLDPDHPPARRELILTEAGVKTVVTTRELAGELPGGVSAVLLDDPALTQRPERRPNIAVDPRNLAYTIFTSGSTGRPKGVQVEHRAIVNFTKAAVELFRLGTGDRVLQFANPIFDVSLFDFFSALCSGAALVQAPVQTLLDPESLTVLMRSQQVTVTDLPPSVLRLLDPDALPSLRALFVGLEAFPGELVNRWNTPDREFHNGYGPTEATVACVDYRCPQERYEVMPPIGTPMANYRAYVVDGLGHLLPVGLAGELLIGGVGLARGYVNQPGLTAEKFVPDPFGQPGGRLYRTGDLVRWRPDGNLEFLGRIDDQVKLQGMRIEPAEIERAINSCRGVADAAVAVQRSEAGARLVAYVVAADAAWLDVARVRAELSHLLPLHLVPAVFVPLDRLPRSPSGKLDRKQLPEPDAAAQPAEFQPPSTQTQQILATMWRDLLSVERIGIHDNFFSLNGNSFKITQLAARILEEFGVEVELRDLFVNATIGELATLIEDRELAMASEDDLLALLGQAEADDSASGASQVR
jgi:amino acid adenylation domain-containing protein